VLIYKNRGVTNEKDCADMLALLLRQAYLICKLVKKRLYILDMQPLQ